MQVSNYGIEEIPDTARLYYRVHKNIYMATGLWCMNRYFFGCSVE